MSEEKTEAELAAEAAAEGASEEVVTLKKEEYDKYVADSQAKENLVAEIIELREKKQLSDSEKEELQKKVDSLTKAPVDPEVTPGSTTQEQIDEMIKQGLQKTLSERETSDTERSRKDAIVKFKELNKEFHEDNDEGGLKFSALEKELGAFNMDSARTVEDFLSLMDKARTFIKKDGEQPQVQETPYSSTPANEGGQVPAQNLDEKNLSDKERKLITNSFNGNTEEYLKQKAKRPDYVEKLLSYVY